MARCERCDACQSMWDFSACTHCGYPGADKRTPEQKAQDDKDYEQRWKEQEDYDNETGENIE